MTPKKKNPAAAALGKLGGQKTSLKKKIAARLNAQKPRSSKRTIFERMRHQRAGDKLTGAA